MSEPNKKRVRIRRFSMKTILPNVVTMLALSAGLTAIRFAINDNYEMAVIAIIIAGLLDGLDGSLARRLKSSSRFGAELDSLSDVVSFGVAPAIVLYLWALQNLGGIGWVASLSFTVCCALRLARFNSQLDDEDEAHKRAGFFTGIPAPMAAGLSLIPMMLEFELQNGVFSTPWLVGITTFLLCFGMVSRLPTYALKGLIVPREYLVPFLLLVGLFAAALTVYDWWTVATIGLVYVATMPISAMRFHKRRKNAE